MNARLQENTSSKAYFHRMKINIAFTTLERNVYLFLVALLYETFALPALNTKDSSFQGDATWLLWTANNTGARYGGSATSPSSHDSQNDSSP